jgi:hypothetical protein
MAVINFVDGIALEEIGIGGGMNRRPSHITVCAGLAYGDSSELTQG